MYTSTCIYVCTQKEMGFRILTMWLHRWAADEMSYFYLQLPVQYGNREFISIYYH